MTICIAKLMRAVLKRAATATLLLGFVSATTPASHAEDQERKPLRNLNDIKHIIVIYQENWSFDSLYGRFPGANGLANAAGKTAQVDATGKPITVTPQPW